MKVPVKGVTTSGSVHPRTELREMTSSGSEAGWGSKDGTTHTMTFTSTVTHLPYVTQRTVPMQVFNGGGGHPWMEVFAQVGKGVYFYLNDSTGSSHVTYHVDPDWTLGKSFTMKTVIYNGNLKFYYNDMSTPN